MFRYTLNFALYQDLACTAGYEPISFWLPYLDGGSSRRASLRAESVREQGLCKRERRQGSVGRRLTAFDGLCEVIKTTAAV